ncbi:MAG: hypothetical protein IRZ05_17805, partial [Micromonosporaceae bacterium]|nr:hypothetical protein [Micromonosporaceae bacterium]
VAGAEEVARGVDAGPDHDPFALDFGGGAAEPGDGATGLDHDPAGLDHVGFGSGAGRVDPAAGPGDAADTGAAGHPHVDDLVALDGLDAAGDLAGADDLDSASHLDGSAGLDGSASLGGREPVAGHHDHHGVDPGTVDGEPTGGE